MKFTRIIAAATSIALGIPAITNVSALLPREDLPVGITIFGDVNGDNEVNGQDVIKLIEYFLYSDKTSETLSPFAGMIVGYNTDVDMDGKYSLMDLATIKQYSVGDAVTMGGRSLNAQNEKSQDNPFLRIDRRYVIPHRTSESYTTTAYIPQNYEEACKRLELYGIPEYSSIFDNINIPGSPDFNEADEKETAILFPRLETYIDLTRIGDDMSYRNGSFDEGELWAKNDGIDIRSKCGDTDCVEIFVINVKTLEFLEALWKREPYGDIYGFRNGSDLYMQYIPVPKPVIYLYPEEETEVNVKLDFDGKLTHTYPEYPENGWNVTAQPDGTLTDKDGYEYSYLFWDGIAAMDYDMSEGFVVKGEDTASFLREKLSYMGLTPREYNEFIVYMLPQMENNKYNLISFQQEAYTDIARLDITPTPDSMQRIFMTYKALDEYIDVPEQELPTFERKGFSVVEWGGTEVK